MNKFEPKRHIDRVWGVTYGSWVWSVPSKKVADKFNFVGLLWRWEEEEEEQEQEEAEVVEEENEDLDEYDKDDNNEQ